MKNGGKSKSVAFIILFSIFGMKITYTVVNIIV